MSRRAEVLEQRAVVRSHVDDELRSFEAQERGRLALQLREVLAQDLRRAARVRVLGRKQNSRIDNQPELHELTRPAAQQLRRIRRLLVRTLPDRTHLVHGRQVSEKQHRFEVGGAAHLTAIDDDARSGARRACKLLNHSVSVRQVCWPAGAAAWASYQRTTTGSASRSV